MKMALRAKRKGFTGPIWPAGRSLESLLCMNKILGQTMRIVEWNRFSVEKLLIDSTALPLQEWITWNHSEYLFTFIDVFGSGTRSISL